MIRKLEYEDYDLASEILWKSFYDAEKHGIAMSDGVFREFMMAIEFIPGALPAGSIQYSAAFDVDAAQLEEFETHFPPKVKRAKKDTDLA